ncbi:MAG: response regulator transcription factor [Bryobacteraceae bacterium]|nr:response regulator transcription factor [Bryobacteraceae bacterium]
MPHRILLVEDEPGLVMTLTDRLVSEGYAVESREDGESGLEEALSGTYDLVLLDVMLPCKGGFDVCRKIRQAGLTVPILMLTARSQVVDKVVGLQLGADDYLTKPFDMMELLARVEALLRRWATPSVSGGSILQFGSLQIDLRRAEVRKDNQPVNLSAREFQLLRYLVEHRGETLSRERLLTEVWGYEAGVPTRTVDVHIAWLRQKLEQNPRNPQHLITLRGLGYRFQA